MPKFRTKPKAELSYLLVERNVNDKKSIDHSEIL